MSENEECSSAVTEGIRISVEARYLPERSAPMAGRYLFSYTVRIQNNGPQAAQLLSRHWVIADIAGNVDEVRGDGVVGEQPLLRPGAEFEYTSAAVLKTPRGTMSGSYQMQRPNGRTFDAVIAPFVLGLPYSLN